MRALQHQDGRTIARCRAERRLERDDRRVPVTGQKRVSTPRIGDYRVVVQGYIGGDDLEDLGWLHSTAHPDDVQFPQPVGSGGGLGGILTDHDANAVSLGDLLQP